MFSARKSLISYIRVFFCLLLVGILSLLLYQNATFKKTIDNQAQEITLLKNPDPYACWVTDVSNYKNLIFSHPPHWIYKPNGEVGGIIKLTDAHVTEQYIDEYDYNLGGTIKIHIQTYPNPNKVTLEKWLDENPPKQVIKQYPYSTANFHGIAREELDATISKDRNYSALSVYTTYKDKIYKIIGVPFDADNTGQFYRFYDFVGTIQFREDYDWVGDVPTPIPTIVKMPSAPEATWNPAADPKNRFKFRYPPTMEFGGDGEIRNLYVTYSKDLSNPLFYDVRGIEYDFTDNGGDGFYLSFNYEEGSKGVSTVEWISKVTKENIVYSTPTPSLREQSSVKIGNLSAEKLYECRFSCKTLYYIPLSSGIVSATLRVNGTDPEYAKLAEKIIATLED